jgi:hypothetical protein
MRNEVRETYDKIIGIVYQMHGADARTLLRLATELVDIGVFIGITWKNYDIAELLNLLKSTYEKGGEES